jgi:hypothetical protein
MIFGEAIEALKEGKRVARKGWNGKGMFLALAYPTHSLECSAAVMFNRKFDAVSLDMDNFIVMKTAGNTLVPWLASQTDILSEDWMIVD